MKFESESMKERNNMYNVPVYIASDDAFVKTETNQDFVDCGDKSISTFFVL